MPAFRAREKATCASKALLLWSPLATEADTANRNTVTKERKREGRKQ
jgi:hypothetical protein